MRNHFAVTITHTGEHYVLSFSNSTQIGFYNHLTEVLRDAAEVLGQDNLIIKAEEDVEQLGWNKGNT